MYNTHVKIRKVIQIVLKRLPGRGKCQKKSCLALVLHVVDELLKNQARKLNRYLFNFLQNLIYLGHCKVPVCVDLK
jgi:hypothetical protein